MTVYCFPLNCESLYICWTSQTCCPTLLIPSYCKSCQLQLIMDLLLQSAILTEHSFPDPKPCICRQTRWKKTFLKFWNSLKNLKFFRRKKSIKYTWDPTNCIFLFNPVQGKMITSKHKTYWSYLLYIYSNKENPDIFKDQILCLSYCLNPLCPLMLILSSSSGLSEHRGHFIWSDPILPSKHFTVISLLWN